MNYAVMRDPDEPSIALCAVCAPDAGEDES
jgi:hypothetical protein